MMLRGLEQNKISGALTYFGTDELLEPAFAGATPEDADRACLAFWRQHRAELLNLWSELVATGQQPRDAVAWGWALEQGWDFHRWYHHNRAAAERAARK